MRGHTKHHIIHHTNEVLKRGGGGGKEEGGRGEGGGREGGRGEGGGREGGRGEGGWGEGGRGGGEGSVSVCNIYVPALLATYMYVHTYVSHNVIHTYVRMCVCVVDYDSNLSGSRRGHWSCVRVF